MQVTLKCPECGSALPFDAANAPDAVTCGGCGQHLPLSVSDGLRSDSSVDKCPQCQGSDFYVRRDFDPKRGLTVVIIAIAISAGFYWFGLDLVAYSVLALFALIDLIVYRRLKDLTVCYRCHTVFRGTYTPTAPIFDLATADELELEWARELEKREKRGSSPKDQQSTA